MDIPRAGAVVFRRVRGVARRVVGSFVPKDKRTDVGAAERIHLANPATFVDLGRAALEYARSLRITKDGKFVGYLFASTSETPVLYATLAALLLKHLLDARNDECVEELDYVVRCQCDDGLFRDPAIDCAEVDSCEWWGTTHQTAIALMCLALYERDARYGVRYIDEYLNIERLYSYLGGQDWGARAAWTSNAVQNLGVMLQYARDYQNVSNAARAIEALYDYLDAKQDRDTGLFGNSFSTAAELSLGVQAGYHFWLLYSYDERPIRYVENVINSVLKTQSLSGGFGVRWNSSACEDIDSIDPLVRLSRHVSFRREDVMHALLRSVSALVRNVNPDGGWVFRRDEPLFYGFSRHMMTCQNESNLFFTWFRLLSLALALDAVGEKVAGGTLRVNWALAPGYQFLR